VGVHERREGAELNPAHEQLGRTALDQTMSQVATDIM
jgi:hypothetical protein